MWRHFAPNGLVGKYGCVCRDFNLFGGSGLEENGPEGVLIAKRSMVFAPEDVCAVRRHVREFVRRRDGDRFGFAILKPAHGFVRFIDGGCEDDVSVLSDIGESKGGGNDAVGAGDKIAK